MTDPTDPTDRLSETVCFMTCSVLSQTQTELQSGGAETMPGSDALNYVELINCSEYKNVVEKLSASNVVLRPQNGSTELN